MGEKVRNERLSHGKLAAIQGKEKHAMGSYRGIPPEEAIARYRQTKEKGPGEIKDIWDIAEEAFLNEEKQPPQEAMSPAISETTEIEKRKSSDQIKNEVARSRAEIVDVLQNIDYPTQDYIQWVEASVKGLSSEPGGLEIPDSALGLESIKVIGETGARMGARAMHFPTGITYDIPFLPPVGEDYSYNEERAINGIKSLLKKHAISWNTFLTSAKSTEPRHLDISTLEDMWSEPPG